MKKWIFGVLLVLACASCKPEESKLTVDMNGMVLGDNSKPPETLVVGIGESVDEFLVRNPFLNSLKIPGKDYVLNLPLMTRVNAIYDDGDVKFNVGCSMTTNIDGNDGRVGIHHASFQLCEPAVDDWASATHRAEQLIMAFAQQNPNMINLREFRKTHSLDEAEKLFGGSLIDGWTKAEFPLREKQANQFFKKAADEGHIQQLQFSQGSYALMTVFFGDQITVDVGITKGRYWLEVGNLTEQQKKAMKYEIAIVFVQNKSKEKLCNRSGDFRRCIP